MSAAGKTTVTVSYRRRGVAPPVFIAGSFSDPAWQPQEMHSVTDESGEHHFTIQIPVSPGKEYLYKFKTSDRDDWFLDEHSTIVNDNLGKSCNLLKVPMTSNTSDRAHTPLVEATEHGNEYIVTEDQPSVATSHSKSLLSDVLQNKTSETDQRSRTPIKQVAAVAAEVADTAAKLDNLDLKPSPLQLPRDIEKKGRDTPPAEKQINTPLFAHESFGAYEIVDDGLDHDDFGKNPKSPNSLLSDSGCSVDGLDIGDPTLEIFPSDRTSVLDTLRKIQSSTEDGRSSLDDGQHSTSATSRRTSVDSSEGNDFTLSPTSSRKRDNRTSRSSFGRPRSAVSLSCIDEEPKAAEVAGSESKHSKKQENLSGSAGATSNEGTDDDGGLVMKTAKA
ncbi:hypothetical protein QQS21_009126 [Conoideocrella luteorostrata]|uniref:AMP-activated protein kinase glycogen-binding domain-containing protein n=1 Tax=Conoideocrella luteorostrata TaxID=1105319 RepID=A0AAJ0CHN8_9HYPO|nr:hypothetical protein QQS21_009126 [Conoideocrella luteorostrata]